jgi:NADPH2:quinone reductase
VDRVVDVDVSGTAPLLPALLARGGMCAAYGANTGAATVNFGAAIMKGIAVRFFIVYELTEAQRAIAIGALNPWLERGLLHHTIAAHAPLADGAAAHDAVERGDYIGNLVLDC